MQTQFLTHDSASLGKEMHMMIYGHGGVPFLVFPTQDGMCRQMDDFGVTDQLRDYINNGLIQLFVVDTIDLETWSNKFGDKGWRAWRQEQYFHYIVDEVVPLMREYNDQLPVVMGMSMGYNTDYFFNGYMDSTLYDNSPERFLPNMPEDHIYIDLYNQKDIIFCVGQGAWEDDGVDSLRYLQSVFEQKGIHAWCDFWGYDVNHDWPWWFKQLHYFLPKLLHD